ncbi:glycoside hydrolase family 3 C-terminal domain-containing protein [Flavobacterium plurextorum]|uniref:beta-glucosidase n=1 Tax=Flavobacterium TaxID=237 RepID=UPI00214D5651|nr:MULTISPECIES: glycoside hydrolase family 3 C-terminal domain-containing protein [Flavobacterium]UUW08328.1 glycoside hydrolase family 3 C-terminal domain-containing protein [Flavobacterium plurextorum]
MKFILKMIGVSLTFLSIPANAQSHEKKIKEILSKMTLEEKASFVVGTGMSSNVNSANGAVGATMGKVNGAAGTTFPIDRLQLPAVITADGPAGLRIDPIRKDDPKTYYCTAFPVATLLGSSWDIALVDKVGKAMGSEVKAYGVDVLLAPGINIQRNPLGGRNFEYYSEDPLISGYIGAAMINGLQSNGIGTSLKHFAVNNQETNRTVVNSVISERALREIYLKGFEIALQRSKPWTVMSSYNKINGEYASESHDLLTGILREEWGYKGFVMTDWFGGRNTLSQVQAGNDLLMPGTPSKVNAIIKAVEDKTLDIKELDLNVERILSIVMKTPSYNKIPYTDNPNLQQNAQIARDAAAQGMVLLKNNNNVLPLKKDLKIALFGNSSYNIICGGTGSGEVHSKYVINLDQGLEGAGLGLDKMLRTSYNTYIRTKKESTPAKTSLLETPKQFEQLPHTLKEIEESARENDVALLTIGRNGGEGHDRKIDYDFNLTEEEKIFIKQLSDVYHKVDKKLVVILNIDGVIEVASWRDYADAILLAWQPGLEGGNAIADIVSGKVNPSGKLAVTFPVSYTDIPSAKSFPGLSEEKKPKNALYEEGIYVGYRYYDTFDIKPAYEFGYGLSYTSFEYAGIKLGGSDFKNKLKISIDITNKGKFAGREIVQLYISGPNNNIKKPLKELKGFAKTKMLAPGEKQTVSFLITEAELASFYTEESSWIADSGIYKISIGASSRDIKKTATFNIANKIVVKKVSPKLPLKEDLKEL